jgi:hypothetical protein
MIERFLVPIGARPPAAAAATQRRRPTTMDERTLVPAMLPIVQLNGQSTIPTNLPLDSIATRVVVPRDISAEAYGVKEDSSTPLQPTDLDERITVPQGAAPPETIKPFQNLPTDLIDPDIFITGEVHLVLPEPPPGKAKWELFTRISSVAFHILLLAAILLQSKLFPPRPLTQEEIERGQRMMTVLLPPGTLEALKPSTRPPQPVPKVHLDPRVLREIAPPVLPTPAPERAVKELPSAPVPKANAVQPEPQVSAPTPKLDAPKPALRLETPDTPQPQHGLILPKSTSPSQAIQDSVRAAGRASGPRPIVGGDRVSSGRAQGGGGGGGGTAYGGLEMLTPNEGVDFNGYLMRVYYTVKRNWFAVMPTSVELGEKGIVQLTFRIMRDGTVPATEPVIQHNSGKEHLDRAAYSSVRASSPFESLPPQFSGPYIELRYTYFYNIVPDSVNQQQ